MARIVAWSNVVFHEKPSFKAIILLHVKPHNIQSGLAKRDQNSTLSYTPIGGIT